MTKRDRQYRKQRDRLPKRPPKPAAIGADEKVIKSTGADLQNGWLGRHGELSLTSDRLVFIPTPLDRVLQARSREFRLEDVTEIERYPIHVDHNPPGGKRQRMYLHTDECAYQFMVPDLDGWIDMLDIVARRRAEERGAAAPVITRDGRENPLVGEF